MMHALHRGALPLSASLLTLLVPVSAGAHHFMDEAVPRTVAEALLSGLAHPVVGADHLLFLAIVGFLTAAMRTGERFLAVSFFIGATLLGAALRPSGVELGPGEKLVASTLVAGGALLLTRLRPSAGTLAMLLLPAGLFHGQAFGALLLGAPLDRMLAYGAGLAAAQATVVCASAFLLTRVQSKDSFPAPVERFVAAFALLVGLVGIVTGTTPGF
jgi:urease accessory protein